MENAAQSSRPDARIIKLRSTEALRAERLAADPTMILEMYTLEYIDQMLDEHFQ